MSYSFLKSEITRNISLLVVSNVIGQGISFLAYIILARLYDTTDFGIFAIFSSVTGLLSILATGGYEQAFIISQNKKAFYSILGFTLKFLITFCIFTFLIFLFLKKPLSSLFGIESISRYWVMIPLTIFVTGLFSILTNIANKKKKFKSIAVSNVSLNAYSSGLKFGFFYIFKNAAGLIYANFAGYLLACFSFFNLRKSLAIGWRQKWSEQKDASILYKAFPLYELPRTFVNSFSGNLPFLVLGIFFSESLLGLFSLALTLIFRPINLFSNSLYRVFYERFAHLKNTNEKISSSLNRYWKYLLLFGLPCFLILYFLAPFIFNFIFPENWKGSETFFQILLPWMFLVLGATPFGFIPILFNKQHISFILEIVYLFIRLIALVIGIICNDFQLAIILFSSSGTCFLLVISIWYTSLIRKYEKNI